MIIRQLCRRKARILLQPSRFTIQSGFLSTAQDSVQPIAQVPLDSVPSSQKALSSVGIDGENNGELAVKEWASVSSRRRQFSRLGSVVTATYNPESLLLNPPYPSDVTLELLLASQSHLGHATSLWNPRNSSYIFGIRESIHIISLEVTAAHLRRAAKVVEEVSRRGGIVLFVGTRKGQRRCVVKAAEMAKGYHVYERWIPGSLTNGQQILGHCELKVVDVMDRELPHFKQCLKDRPVLKPDLVICLNPLENEVLLHECGLHNVPTIGIIDTDADPTRVTYPIPANDDSLRCVYVIAGVLGRAGQEGQKKRLEQSRKGDLPYKRISKQELFGERQEGEQSKSG